MLTLLCAGSTSAIARDARRPPSPEPPPQLSTAGEACSATYHARLTRIAAEAGERMSLAFQLMRQPDITRPGRWIVVDEIRRTRLRDTQGRIVDGDRVCAEQVKHASRVRCIRWETYQPDAPLPDPELPLPETATAEEKLRDFYDDSVGGRGSAPEFGDNGRYTAMTGRVTQNLPIYMGQPAHPALCTGAKDMLAFLADNLVLLRKRADMVYAQGAAVEVLALERVAALGPPAMPTVASLDPGSVTTAVEPAAAGVPAGPAFGMGDLPPAPRGLRLSVRLARAVAARVLAPGAIARVEREQTPLPAIEAVLEGMRSAAGTSAPAVQRMQARVALRTIELLSYAELSSERYREIDDAVFGTLSAAQKAQAESCTCPE